MSSTRNNTSGLIPPNDDTRQSRPAAPSRQPSQPTGNAIPTVHQTNHQTARKHRHIGRLSFFGDANAALPSSTKSFHPVEKVTCKDRIRYYKHNKEGSLMSALEAVGWSLYHLVEPDYVPEKVNAHYNDQGKYVGVSVTEIPGFSSIKESPLTENDLKNEEVLKGLAICMVLSWFFAEDDLHRGNMDKFGHRIDFDMSLYPITGYFKDSAFLQMYRPSDPLRFNITARDIENFPTLIDAKPFYWPTKPQPMIDEGTRNKLSSFLPISNNAFQSMDNELLKKLSDNPTFIYYKYKTMLKLSLLNKVHFKQRIQDHLHKDITHPDPKFSNVKIADLILDFVLNRQQILRQTLVNMPSFQDFILRDGEDAKISILEAFTKSNHELLDREKRKYVKHSDRPASILINNLIDPDEVEEIYNNIFREMRDCACDSNNFTQKLK